MTTEKTYIKTPTNLFEAMLKLSIPADVVRVVGVIVRFTFGYQKAEAHIPGSVFVRMTGMGKQNVSRALRRALKMNLVIYLESSQKTTSKIWAINKDFSAWKGYSTLSTLKTAPSTKITKRLSTKREYKENKKENKNRSPRDAESSPVFSLFNQELALAKLADKAQTKSKVHRIAGFLVETRGTVYANKEQFWTAWRRASKSAKELEGYNKAQVRAAVEAAKRQGAELGFDWTFETVVKNIEKVANQPERAAHGYNERGYNAAGEYEPYYDKRLDAERDRLIQGMTPEQKKRYFNTEEA